MAAESSPLDFAPRPVPSEMMSDEQAMPYESSNTMGGGPTSCEDKHEDGHPDSGAARSNCLAGSSVCGDYSRSDEGALVTESAHAGQIDMSVFSGQHHEDEQMPVGSQSMEDKPVDHNSCFPGLIVPAMVLSNNDSGGLGMGGGNSCIIPLTSDLQNLSGLQDSLINGMKIIGIVVRTNQVMPLPLHQLALLNSGEAGNEAGHTDLSLGMPNMNTGSEDGQHATEQELHGSYMSCDMCSAQFPSADELANHLLLHQRSVRCPHCQNESILADPDAKEFCCGTCGKSAKLVEADEVDGMDRDQGEGAEGGRHVCTTCKKSYKYQRYLRKHERSHHPEMSSKRGRYLGDGVSVGSLSEYSINSSFQKAARLSNEGTPDPSGMRYHCQQCIKSFRGSFELRRHVMTVHENRRPHKCHVCGKMWRDTYELKRHMTAHQRATNGTSGGASPDYTRSMLLGESMETAITSSVLESSTPIPQPRVLPAVSTESAQEVTPYTVTTVSTSPSSMAVAQSDNSDMVGMSSSDFAKNVAESGGSSGAIFFCPPCEKYFRGPHEFKRHCSIVHEKKFRYKCSHCSKLWRDQYDLKRHCRRMVFGNQDVDREYIMQCRLDLDDLSGREMEDEDDNSSHEDMHTETMSQVVEPLLRMAAMENHPPMSEANVLSDANPGHNMSVELGNVGGQPTLIVMTNEGGMALGKVLEGGNIVMDTSGSDMCTTVPLSVAVSASLLGGQPVLRTVSTMGASSTTDALLHTDARGHIEAAAILEGLAKSQLSCAACGEHFGTISELQEHLTTAHNLGA